MSVVTPVPGAPEAPAGAGTWRVSWSGVRTVAALELRQRVRSTRWVIVLVVWFVVLLGLTLLLRRAVASAATSIAGIDPSNGSTPQELRDYVGAAVFGAVVFMVLALGGLVAPALAATSVNGDRTAGVLAALQTTLLTPAEIALGKLAAAWVTALALLAAALPCILWSFLDGGTPPGRLLTTLVVLALTLLVVCAVALGWSALTARASSSTVLTYLTIVFLGLGLPLTFAFTLPLVTQDDRVQVRQFADEGVQTDPSSPDTPPAPPPCETVTTTASRQHTERSWWLLAANPFVVVADTAPPVRLRGQGPSDPLTIIRDGVREARLGPPATEDDCYESDAASQARATQRENERDALPATWPYGLGADLLLAAGFTALAVRRLRAPAHKLPRGTRVA
ncbi:MAG TPA: ABC transporter permease subunit [Kineosporiaceae bacterium]|jgi:ABC-type transport system involved in multi-copper enzyme maturation permease subunit|nr:ABC transporter permease subunit [Kineosporiaceae bacterium]